MKHLKPLAKAETTTDVTSIITMIASLLTALAPIIQYAANQKNQEV